MGCMMKKLVAIILCVLVMTGCNTVRGVGKDIEQAGEAIRKSAK